MAVAVVSGSTGVIGRAFAAEFARAGHGVFLLGRDPDRLAKLNAELRADQRGGTGARCRALMCDLRDTDAVATLGPELAHELRFEQVVLINCAGRHGPLGAIGDASPAEWRAVLTVNLTSAAMLSAALVPGMITRGWGRIVNVSSQAGLSAPSGLNAPYATSKAALNRMTAELAVSLAGTGVTAHALHPGEVVSAMHSHIASAAAGDDRLSGFASWARRTRETPDDPRAAALLAVDLVDGRTAERLNGMFLWPSETDHAPRDLRDPHA